jgi:RNA methyltransferase, TrmH family
MRITKTLLKERSLLRMKKFRQQGEQVVVDGRRILEQLAAGGIMPTEIYLVRGDDPFPRKIPRYELTPEEMHRLVETEQPQTLAALFAARPPVYRAPPMQLYLDRISDPGNLGTILRTAAAAGVSVLLSPDCCDPFNPKAIRASLGASFYHPWREISEADLFNLGLPLLTADMTGASLWDYRPAQSFVCVIGSEAMGVAETLLTASTRISIPMSGNMESLNAAVAAGIFLFYLQAAAQR